jgi:hypothetical protein
VKGRAVSRFDGKPVGSKRAAATVATIEARSGGIIRGYPRLLLRLGRAYEHKDKNERHAWARVFMALADFLVENGLVGRGALWLQESASTLTDPDGSKALPSKTWRRFAQQLLPKMIERGGAASVCEVLFRCRQYPTLGFSSHANPKAAPYMSSHRRPIDGIKMDDNA